MDSECILDELWVIIQRSLDPISSVALRRVCRRLHKLRAADDILPPLLQYVWDVCPVGDRTLLFPAFYELAQTSHRNLLTILSLRCVWMRASDKATLVVLVSPRGYLPTLELYFVHDNRTRRWGSIDYGTREDCGTRAYMPCWIAGRVLDLISWEKNLLYHAEELDISKK
jgi:hypothetical protein